MYTNASSFTGSVQPWNDIFRTIIRNIQHLASPFARDTSHVVMDSWQNRDGFLGDVNTGKDGSGLRDTGKTFFQQLWGQVRKVQVDMIFLVTNSSSLTNLNGHGARDNVTGSQILGGRSVFFHEAFSVGIEEVSTLTSGT
eukprot:Lithocolla_globosa_v1_NODE_5904_length_1167_cov_59.942446.p2 type:complete len:140 gc:universal NODE_5904_length_1167_cov_59.942446:646-1065(+)